MKNISKGIHRYLKFSNLVLLSCALFSELSTAKGVLETPVLRSPNSGISTISGWHCTSNDIEVYIDGKSFGQAGTGTLREDTAEVCGHSSTGFSLLVNYGAFEDGAHTVRVLADGELLSERLFFTTRIGGADVEYATGLNGSTAVYNFPKLGDVLQLKWVEDQQSFMASGRNEDLLPREREKAIRTLNGTFSGTQRMYASTGKKLTGLNKIDFDISVTESTFTLNFNDPELGECTFNGDIEFNFYGHSESSGNYSCDGTEGSYTAQTTAKEFVIPHLVFIHQADIYIDLDGTPFSPENKVIIIRGQRD